MKEKQLIEFFTLATQYYVAGRFAALAHLNPVIGNLLHHAIEMYLKGCLSKNLSLSELKKLGHNLPCAWTKFKTQTTDPALNYFDRIVKRLHDFEELRYPDSILTKGMASTINIRSASLPAGNGGPDRTEPIYELCLEEIDELVTKLFAVASVNPSFFTGPLNPIAKRFLLDQNHHTAQHVNEDGFVRILGLVIGHRKPEETLNRLFRKHLDNQKKHIAAFPPYLTRENTEVTAETKPKLEFVKLAQVRVGRGIVPIHLSSSDIEVKTV
jgi:hypothetical protein